MSQISSIRLFGRNLGLKMSGPREPADWQIDDDHDLVEWNRLASVVAESKIVDFPTKPLGCRDLAEDEMVAVTLSSKVALIYDQTGLYGIETDGANFLHRLDLSAYIKHPTSSAHFLDLGLGEILILWVKWSAKRSRHGVRAVQYATPKGIMFAMPTQC